MFLIYSVALLSAATAGIADTETSRVDYSNCLIDFTTNHLDQKTARGTYIKAAQTTCMDKRNAMIAAIKKDELEFGSTEQEATDYATEEADGVLTSFTDAYAGYLSSNTRPVKQ
ncbi:hypothetical protein AB1K62_03955 [Parasphingorhabdus sp. JC815]|uniref:hypothetical protein n=1 Tax=Parasphingorhabdus sp. JC815 TaxID=3232140 RepID=UPI0034598D4D